MREIDTTKSKSYWDSFWGTIKKQKRRITLDPRREFEAPIKLYKNIKILDAGCGLGFRAKHFRECDFFVGLDSSKGAIEVAQREFGRTYDNVAFIVGDLEHLPFKQDIFDVIIFSEVLEHIFEEKREIVLLGLLQVISSKGQMFLTTPNGMYLPILIRRILHFLSRGLLRSTISHHIYDHPIFPSSLMKLLKNTGWNIILYKGETHIFPYTMYNSPNFILFAVLQFLITVPS